MAGRLVLNIAILCSLYSTAVVAFHSSCKCIPSYPCWPSPTTWTSLNSTVTGRVLPTKLPESVCSQGGEGSNTYVVNATDATHVQAALQFARDHNLKVNINNTGHAGQGRSSTCGALFISTHNMKGLEFHRSYTPQSCSANSSHMAANLGAGEQGDDVYQALAKYNVVTVGGTYSTVGIVGWATGGGHGWLTSEHGMGADNILEVEMVTTAGRIIVANECQNSDVFWAIRGGGGGTFGVITSITMKTYPMPQTTQFLWNISAKNGTKSTDWWKLVARLHPKLVTLNEQGFQGYYTTSGPMTLGGFFLAYDKSNATITQILDPFLTEIKAAEDMISLVSIVTRYDTWIDAYNALPAQSRDNTDGPGGVISTTRLLTRKGLTEDIEATAKMFEVIGSQAEEFGDDITIPMISGSLTASSKPVDSALNPAWRDTAVHMIVKISWKEDIPKERVDQLHNAMTNKIGYAMRQISPDSGCYVNECDQFEPNWQWAMYGPNYSRLSAVKANYDVDNVLWCRRCIRSEEWEYDQGDSSLCLQPLGATWPNFANGH